MTLHDAPGATKFTSTLAGIEGFVAIDPVTAAAQASGLLPEVDDAGTVAERLWLRRILAMAHAHANAFELALAICDEAENLDRAGDEPVELARVHLASMQPLAITGQVERAIAAGKSALAILDTAGQPDLAGRAALNLGAIYAMTGRPDAALPWFDRARQHLSGVALLMGQVETNRGTALAALDRFRESEVAFEHAIELLYPGEHSWAIAIAEGNLAGLAARQGDLRRSLRSFESSRRRLEHDEDWGDLGRINAEEAALLGVMGMADAAGERFVEAIAMLEEHGAPADLAAARIAFAQVLADSGRISDAETHLAGTGDLIDEEQHRDLYLRLVSLRARLALARNDTGEAAAAIQVGLDATETLPVQQVRWTILQAACDRLRGDASVARARLLDALANAAGVAPLIADVEAGLADLAREQGDTEAARRHARSAIDAIERVRGTIHGDRLRQAWHHGRLGIYGSLYLALLADPDRESQREAFAIAERIRNRSLLDAMGVDTATSVAIAGQEQPLIAELDDQRRWLNWMYSTLADGQEPDPDRVAELAGRERAARQLEDRLAAMRPGPGFQQPLSLDDVRDRLLRDDSLLLSYLVVDDVLTVQVVTRNEAWGVVDLAPVAVVRELVGDLQFQIARALAHGTANGSAARQARLQRDADAVLDALYQAVVAPVEDALIGARRIVVAPSGDLHSVPFAALRRHGEYLADRLEIVVAPGVSVAATMPAPDGGWSLDPAHAFVAGVPDATAPDLGAEARMVAARFPRADLLLDHAATRQAVLAAVPGAGLVHLATHGRFDPRHPAASGLRVADGWLTLDDLSRVRLDQPLVVLTGCETGRVMVGDGDDLEGLMAALIAAGATGLVASLWKTHDRAATALVNALYDALATQSDPASALRRAQLAARATYAHPAFWAPFVAVHGGTGGS